MIRQINVEILYEYFDSIFCWESFLQIFYFMNGYIDMKKLLALVKYYMKSMFYSSWAVLKLTQLDIYVTFVTQCKLHVNLMKFDEKRQLNSYKILSNFWNIMTLHSDFNNIIKEQFFKIIFTATNHIYSLKVWNTILLNNNLKFMSLEPPSSPAQMLTT